MTLSDMAREIERMRPETLPVSFRTRPKLIEVVFEETPDLAHAILVGAMVMAGLANRNLEGWEFFDDDGDMYETLDRDHDGCPTRSLFAAFVAVFKENNDA